VVHAYREEENDNGSHSNLDGESDHDNHDDEGCNHEVGHGDHNHPQQVDTHDGQEESENVQTVRADALLESIPVISIG
jgi:hypothetical protein